MTTKELRDELDAIFNECLCMANDLGRLETALTDSNADGRLWMSVLEVYQEVNNLFAALNSATAKTYELERRLNHD